MSLQTRLAAIDAKHGQHVGAEPGRCTIAKWVMVVSWLLLSLYIIPCWVYGGSLNEEIGGQPYPGLGTVAWWVIYVGMTAAWIILCCTIDYFWHELRPERIERHQRLREAELKRRYTDLLNSLWARHRYGFRDDQYLRNRWMPLFIMESHIELTSSSNCLMAGSGVFWADQPAFRVGLDYDPVADCIGIVHYDNRGNRLPDRRLTRRQYRTLLKAIKAFAN